MPLIDITIKCSICGNQLFANVAGQGKSPEPWTIRVQPCPHCLGAEYEKGKAAKVPEEAKP